MGWKTDWLYGLIFARIRDVWVRALRDADRFNQSDLVVFGPAQTEPPPERLYIEQCANANLSEARCSDPVLRSWLYDGTNFIEQTEESRETGIIRRERSLKRTDDFVPPPRFFIQGIVRFYISPDRKRVVFTYALGPLNGRGVVYAVTGQGRTGDLSFAPDSGGWIS